MIDFDSTRLPLSVQAWTAFFDAVLSADAADEDYWTEFKAGLDPTERAGSATLAKSIVGFANRDPQRAAERFGGHGLILLGLEPGNLCGAPEVDPAPMGQLVERFVAAPGPDWIAVTHTFRERRVIVVQVAPPKAGDPIHCIGRSSGSLTDGAVFVRHSGRTEPARSAEVARLAARLLAAARQSAKRPVDVTLSAVIDGGLRRCMWPSSWLDNWIEAERERFLVPLEQALAPPPGPDDVRWGTAAAPFTIKAMDVHDPLRVDERRDPNEYRAAVESYIESCREQFDGIESTAAARALRPVLVTVSNPTATNYKDLRVQIAVGGGTGIRSVDYFRLAKLRPAAPRLWGPYRMSITHPSGIAREWDFEQGDSWLVPGAVHSEPTLDFTPVDLRPEERGLALHETYAVLVDGAADEVRLAWRATATNVDGVAHGVITLPVEATPLDIGDMFDHSVEPRGMVIGGSREGRGWTDGWTF